MKNTYSKKAKQAMFTWYDRNGNSMNDVFNNKQTQTDVLIGFRDWGYKEYPSNYNFKEQPRDVIRFDGGVLATFRTDEF